MKPDRKVYLFSFASVYILSMILNFMTAFEQKASIFGLVSSLILVLIWIYAAVFFKSRTQSLFGFSYWLAASAACILFILTRYEIIRTYSWLMSFLVLFFYTPMSGLLYFSWDLIWFLHIFILFMFLLFSLKMFRLKKSVNVRQAEKDCSQL